MPPKSQKKQKEIIKKEKLQAFILTDDFETKFMPLTAATPRCLLQLGNVPLLEYTLEFLADSGVNEVYLMCAGRNVEVISSYIEKSKWSLPWAPFKVECITSVESRSIGDIMREIDSRSIVTDDFLLISGDVVTNIDLEKAINYHKKIKESDKDHIMTMVASEATATHRTRPFDDESAVFVLNSSNNKCLYYDAIPSINGPKGIVSLDPELLENVEDFTIRNDLIDCHIDICSPIVPAIYQENFDFQHMRKDFVKGILTFDLLKRSIYCYISKHDYGARVSNYKSFKAITKDLIERFIYPVVPELNYLEGGNITNEPKHIYKDEKIVLAQSCKIISNTLIGSESYIDENSYVDSSIIGNNVKIGKNCKIIDSIIFNDVTICDNVCLNGCIIGKNVILKDNVEVKVDAVVGFNCTIGKNMVIGENVRIIAEKLEKDSSASFFSDEEEEVEGETNDEISLEADKDHVKYVGEDGVGFLYESDIEEDNESDYNSDSSDSDDEFSEHNKKEHTNLQRPGPSIYKLAELNISDDSISSIDSESNAHRKSKHGHRLGSNNHKGSRGNYTKSHKQRNSSTNSKYNKKYNRSLSTASQFSVDNPEKQRIKEEEEFDFEASATIIRAIDSNHDLDTAVLELNTLRMSMNVTYSRVRKATMKTLISKVSDYVETNTLKVGDAVVKVFGRWGALFKRQVFDKDDELDLLDVVNHLEKNIIQNDESKLLDGKKLQFFIIQQLYELDICDEDSIVEWYETRKDDIDNINVDKFIEWLQTAEEDDDDDDDEEDDD